MEGRHMTTMTDQTAEPNATVTNWPGSPLSTLHHIAAMPRPTPIEQYRDGAS
jgi:hypothetical protein